MESKSLLIRYINAMLDIIAMLAAYILANKITFHFWRTGIRNERNSYMTLYMIFLVAYFVVILMFFAYDELIERSFVQEVTALVKLYLLMIAIVIGYLYLTWTYELYSRTQMQYFLGISFAFLLLERQCLKRYITKSYHRSGANEKIMLITTSKQAEHVMHRIRETKNWYFRITSIALLDCDRTGEMIGKVEVAASRETLIEAISNSEVDAVFLHLPGDVAFEYPAFIEEMQAMGKRIHLNIAEYEEMEGTKDIQRLGKYATITWYTKKYRIRYRAIKRFADILAGLVGTVLTAAVFLLALAGHMAERDMGQIILPYVRIGKNGRRFSQYRFRTWRNDDRGGEELSRTGRVLKKLGLVDLPMAWNILWGDMSLVGPEAPSFSKFANYTKQQRKGLSVKPGTVQFWPAYYWKQYAKGDITIAECEAEYIDNWTLGLDLKILVRTMGLQLFRPSYRYFMRSIALEEGEEERAILRQIRRDMAPMELPEGDWKHAHGGYLAAKRLCDIVLSAAALVVTSPLFVLIALIIRWTDGQSVFYRQLRIGQYGKKIYIYKFRTMIPGVSDLEKILDAEQLEQYKKEFKIENDPRVTPFGNILRKTSLDELPQLFNVLKGDMSLVGPRPIVEKETKMYGSRLREFLSVRPGLTGYWQAYARNLATYESGERQKMELFYVDRKSFGFDIRILFKTIQAVLSKKGAM